MNNYLKIKSEKGKTFALSRISAIKNEIYSSRKEIERLQSRLKELKNEYNNAPWYKPFSRRKSKQEYENAKTDLMLFNSSVTMSNSKMIEYIAELILYCCLLPVDLLQAVVNWVRVGFETRDQKTIAAINKIAEKNNSSRKKMRLRLSWILRLSIVIFVPFLTALSLLFVFLSHRVVYIPVENPNRTIEQKVSTCELGTFVTSDCKPINIVNEYIISKSDLEFTNDAVNHGLSLSYAVLPVIK